MVKQQDLKEFKELHKGIVSKKKAPFRRENVIEAMRASDKKDFIDVYFAPSGDHQGPRAGVPTPTAPPPAR
jgi:hypothetical protein